MFENQKPNKLYHFTKLSTLIERILPDYSLRMSKLVNMNDPSENMLHLTDIGYSKKPFMHFDDFLMAKQAQTGTSLLSFSVDREIEIEDSTTQIKGYQLQRMWAQYGGNNSGVCLMLDYDSFIEENKAIIKEKEIIDCLVEYDYHNYQLIPTPLLGEANFDENGFNEGDTYINQWNKLKRDDSFIYNRFFTKHIDWNGESEYRFLTFNESAEIFLSIKNSLRKVILGLNSSKQYLPSLINKVSEDKVFYLNIGIDGNFGIDGLN